MKFTQETEGELQTPMRPKNIRFVLHDGTEKTISIADLSDDHLTMIGEAFVAELLLDAQKMRDSRAGQ